MSSPELSIGVYDPFELFPLVKPSVEVKLPLTNLHWRPRVTNTFKSIAKLPVKFVEEVPRKVVAEPRENVYVRLMLIKQTNLETYKAQVRPLIREWLKNLVSKDNTEWMIILYVPIQTRDKMNLMKTSIVDKVRVDFGKDGKQLLLLNMDAGDVERCFRLKEYNDKEVNKLEVYNDLVNSLKELILMTFENKHNHINQILGSSSAIDTHYLRLVLAKAVLFSDLNLFKESLSIFEDASESLHTFCAANPQRLSLAFPKLDLKDFDLQKVLGIKALDELLQQDAIDVFALKSNIFYRKSQLTFDLIRNETLLSINAIHISNLFQMLILFLNDLTHDFGDATLELNYALIDYFLSLPPITNVFNLDSDEVNLSNILEFRGDLRLFQRSHLVKLGQKRNLASKYMAGVFQEVSLSSDGPRDLSLTYEPLVSILTDQQSYVGRFEKLTESIIQDFVICGRSKSIDILSIDLALSKYERKDYKEALNILQDSHEFYLKSGWSFMGAILLEVYLDCIEQLNIDKPSLLLNTYLELFSNLTLNASQIDHNNYRSVKTVDQVQSVLDKIIDSSNQLTQPIEYPVDKIFDITLKPHIHADATDLDTYFVELEVRNPFEISFKLDSIEFDFSDGIRFYAEDLTLDTAEYSVVRAYTSTFKAGLVSPQKLSIGVNSKLTLVHSYEYEQPVVEDNSILSESVVNATSETTQGQRQAETQLYFCEGMSKFSCDLVNPSKLTLGRSQFQLQLTNGKTEISNIQVKIQAADPSFKISSRTPSLETVTLEPEEKHQLDVPFSYFGDNKVIDIGFEIIYESGGRSFEYSKAVSLDTSLTISVSVHDIFKSDYIFSKFQISSVKNSHPIRVLNSVLDNKNENYQVESPRYLPENQVVFSEHQYSSFYKIVPKDDYKPNKKDTFLLTIEYSNLVDECVASVEGMSKELFKESKLCSYWTLFRTLVLSAVKFDSSTTETSGILALENKEEVAELISESLAHVSVEDRSRFQEVVSGLLVGSEPPAVVLKPISRVLEITVPAPSIDILQVISFNYTRKSQYLVGESIPVTVDVESITKWSDRNDEPEDLSIIAESSPTRGKKSGSKEDFQLILSNDEHWLISGFKKKNYSIDFSRSSTSNSIELILIPLIVGNLSLPKVFIKVNNEKDYMMDISVKNGTETLLVVPEVDSIAFSF